MILYDIHRENELTKDQESKFDFDSLSIEELESMVEYLTATKDGKSLFDGEQREKIQEVHDRYKKFGVPIGQCEFIVASGMKHGFDFETALLGLRLGLSTEYGTHEYFTSANVAAITGETPEQVDQYIKDHEKELFEAGHIAKIDFLI